MTQQDQRTTLGDCWAKLVDELFNEQVRLRRLQAANASQPTIERKLLLIAELRTKIANVEASLRELEKA